MSNSREAVMGMDNAGVNLMPPKVFYTCLSGGIVLEIVVGTPAVSGMMALMIAGIFLTVGGFVFMMWGHGRFRSLGVNVPTNLPVSRLVTDGAHGYSRNPMYVGMSVMLVGIGVAAASVWMTLAGVGMFAYLALYVVPREETYLTRKFGQDYEAYCMSVRRWL